MAAAASQRVDARVRSRVPASPVKKKTSGNGARNSSAVSDEIIVLSDDSDSGGPSHMVCRSTG